MTTRTMKTMMIMRMTMTMRMMKTMTYQLDPAR
jgi:hypothetical protein